MAKAMRNVIGAIAGDRIVFLNGPYLPVFVTSNPYPHAEVAMHCRAWEKQLAAEIDEYEKETGVRLHG
jgi:hypothetical protein